MKNPTPKTPSQLQSDSTTKECKRIRELTYSNMEKEVEKFKKKQNGNI